jgi:FtsP/CotA-like multicopper oxidase with cupredoxin domain
MHETEPSKIRTFRTRKVMIILVALVSIVALASGLTVAGVVPLSTILSCIGTSGTSRSFTIIADLNGYNNSKTMASQGGLGPWPVMNVSRCDNVTINLANNDTQSHGLAVGSYTGEYSIAPGQTISVHFTANRTGHWRVFCTILCSVHDYMQNGQLNVT